MALLPGEILHQRYRIVTLLGEGGYGAVYQAWDSADRCQVAIKEYLNPSPEVQQRFRAEARRLADLSHPQLAAVRDHFSLPNVGQYLVSEFVEGVDLQTLIGRYGSLPTDRLVEWLQAVCEPLNYLHQKGQLHLNIKPANIRLTPWGDVFLVDSGLPGLGIASGTPGFAAPEQQKQTGATAATDIYALGATLYTLLTTQPPPNALHLESGLATLIPARDLNHNVEPYLSIVATRALSVAPAARYTTAAEFAIALTRPHGRSQPMAPMRRTPAPHQHPPPKLIGRQRRTVQTRTIWGLVILLLLLIITIGTLSFIQQQELVGGSETAATATTQSQIIAALTSVAPTETPTPLPTAAPTATPAPIIAKTGMRMLYVPGGVFRYGNDEGDPDERPSLLVNIDPFVIDETEVTNGQYAQCVADEACAPPSRSAASYHPVYYGSPDYENYPVVFVDWFAADNFCRWRGARLPTEAEWERAASYDPQTLQRTVYPWGDEFNGGYLNYCDINCPREGHDQTINDGHLDTAPVNSYPEGRSHIGAADMLGNVMEWVGDWYDRNYYSEAPNINPRGPAEGEFKALRGGSWFSYADEVLTTQRGFFDPTVSRAILGFRCAMDAP